MATFKLSKTGLLYVAATGDLSDMLEVAAHKLALVTSDPFTLDWDAVKTDYTYAAGTGLDPVGLATLTKTGPWVDETAEEVYYKYVAAAFTNNTADPVTVTGVAIIDPDSSDYFGGAPFDDPIVLAVGDSVVMGIPIGVRSGVQVMDVEDLVAP